jgi:hypothetical protein
MAALIHSINKLEERMATLDDLVTQFTTAIDKIATEMANEIATANASATASDAMVAARFQPLADRLTALAADPVALVPAAAPGAVTTTGDPTAPNATAGQPAPADPNAPATDGGASTPAPPAA